MCNENKANKERKKENDTRVKDFLKKEGVYIGGNKTVVMHLDELQGNTIVSSKQVYRC